MNFDLIELPTLLASAIVAYLIPKLSPYIDGGFRSAWRFLSNKMPWAIKIYFRNRKAKRLREIKLKRRNIAYINLEIAKLNSLFLIFWGAIGLYLALILLGSPLVLIIKSGFLWGMFSALPIYIAEIAWLAQDLKTTDTIKSSLKIQAPYCSSGCRQLTTRRLRLNARALPERAESSE
jgi:hypothetical protein